MMGREILWVSLAGWVAIVLLFLMHEKRHVVVADYGEYSDWTMWLGVEE